jgi:hypothetical protein
VSWWNLLYAAPSVLLLAFAIYNGDGYWNRRR